MIIKHSSALFLAAILSAATLAGCSVARQQETVGEYVDSSAITAEVKAKLAQDENVSAANVNVKTISAGIVQLSGFAKSQAEKDRAGTLARSVKGVTEVHNNLIVKP